MHTSSAEKAPQHPAPGPEFAPRHLAMLTSLLLALYLVGAFTTRFDRDEWQTMVAAAEVAGGAILYVDVWDNHGPLLTHLLAGLIRLLDSQDHALLMFAGRLSMLAMLATTAWLTGRLARQAWPYSPAAGPVATVVLLCSQTFFGKGLEIRPDVPLLLVFTLCLLMLFRGFRSSRVADFFWSGAALGLGFTLSLKTLLLGASCGFAMLTVMAGRRKVFLSWFILFGSGVLLAPLAMLLLLQTQGSLNDFIASYLGQNLDRVGESWLIGLKRAWHAEEFLLLALAATTALILKRRPSGGRPEGILALLTIAITLLVLYFRLPTHFEQSLLPLLPATAVVITWGIMQLPPTLRLWRWNLPLNLLLLVSVGVCSFDHGWFTPKSAPDLRIARDRQNLMPDGAMIFEGLGLPLFHPRPFVYKSFVHTICTRIREGQLPLDITAGLDAMDVPYAALDRRVASMGPEIETFITQNYLPLHTGDLLAAGTVLQARPGRALVWNVRIAGRYRLSSTASLSGLLIDGQPAADLVDLQDGPHSFSWQSDSPLIVSVALPEQLAAMNTLMTWHGRHNIQPSQDFVN